ncbi:hypothetical protein V1506DRAFT_572631 [Lipomyces tetrasporus]
MGQFRLHVPHEFLNAILRIRTCGATAPVEQYTNANATNTDGFVINTDAGYAGKFEFIASNDNLIQAVPSYTRWTGRVVGGPVGGEQYYGPGVGLWEWMLWGRRQGHRCI